MSEFVVPVDVHHQLVAAAYRHRGFAEDEAEDAARFADLASWHGIQTHNAIKALHLDELFGSGNPHLQGCVPGAKIEKKPTRFEAAEVWDANRKLGQSVAFTAMDRAIELAERFGVGIVSVDNAFHYLWGGGYVIDAAKRGYLAYTNCTAALAEVVPFGGKFPTLGTNPHSWGFPTVDAIGFPVVIDWATSTIAMGRVQQLKREGKELPPGAAVDEQGHPTTDPERVHALLPFGSHKGYGLSLINELTAAFIGGSLPTIRSRPDHEHAVEGEKTSPCFFFQVIHPEAMAGGFAMDRTQPHNVRAVLEDVRGHGNERCLLPGEIEHRNARRSEEAGGLIFTGAEVEALGEIAGEMEYAIDRSAFQELQA